MGTTYSNFQVFCGAADPASVQEQVVGAIRQHLFQLGYEEVTVDSAGMPVDRTVRVGTFADKPWIAVYDEHCDDDFDGIGPWGAALSAKLQRPVLAVTVADSDLACLHLFENGALLEALDSSHRRRKHAAGWARFLTSPTGLKEFTDAFYKKNLFAENNIRAVAPLLGLNPEYALVGYRYLQAEMPGSVALRFRSRTQPERQKGKTRFGYLSQLGFWHDGVPGATKGINTGLTNLGEASAGLRVMVWGPAISDEAIRVDAVRARRKECNESITPVVITATDGRPVCVATFPTFPIPDGFDREDPANKHLSFSKVLDHQYAAGFYVDISVTALKTGSGPLYVAFIPLVNPDGAHRHAISIRIGG